MGDELEKECGQVMAYLDDLHKKVKDREGMAQAMENSFAATYREKKLLSCLYAAMREKSRLEELLGRKEEEKTESYEKKIKAACVSLMMICNVLEGELEAKD